MHPDSLAVLLILLGTVASINCSNKDGAYTDSSSTCHPRFISGSYFKNHSHLVDSDFKDFMARELNLASSQSLMRLSYLHRDLIGEGSHRLLRSSINFDIEPEFISPLSTSICEIIIQERLPSGVFADPFELDHLVHRRVFKDAAVFGDTNLELPSFVSNRSVVEIHMHAAYRKALNLKIEIPVHARYQPLGESGYTRVRFGAPDLLLRCSSESEVCSVTRIAYTNLDYGVVEWSIPSGTKAHGLVVSAVTFCSALFAAAFIIAASLTNSDIRLRQ